MTTLSNQQLTFIQDCAQQYVAGTFYSSLQEYITNNRVLKYHLLDCDIDLVENRQFMEIIRFFNINTVEVLNTYKEMLELEFLRQKNLQVKIV